MAAKKKRRLFYNCIWAILLAILLALPTMGVMELSTLALEQETRCGQLEHNHTQECYFRDLLMCEQKAHNHSQNCYLVLLEDNDINWLLATIENSEEKSLENVIDSAMVQVLNLNPNMTSVNSQQIHLAAENIRELNEAISENHIVPAVVLNENIRDNYLSYIPPQPEPEQETAATEATVSSGTNAPVSGGSHVTVPAQTEAPAITETMMPPTTTEATTPPATTEATTPPATTEATTPPATTEATTPPATTDATEPPATTEATQPADVELERVYLWEYGREAQPLTQKAAEYGQAALYLYHEGAWVCVDVLNMDREIREEQTHYSLSLSQIQQAYRNLLLRNGDAALAHVYYAPQSPAFGIDGVEKIEEEVLRFGTDGSVRHVYLTESYVNATEKLVYDPIDFCAVTLDYTNVDPEAEQMSGFVRSGALAADVCPEGYLWQTEQMEPVETITADISLYAVQKDTQMMMFAAPPGSMLMAAAGDEGIMTTAIGGQPNTNNYKVNFYFLLDGTITFVNTRDLTSSGSFWSPKYTTKSTAVDAYTSESLIVTGLTTQNLGNGYWLYFNSSGNLNKMSTGITISGDKVQFSTSSKAHYAILSAGRGNSYSPINFHTVKLDYSAVEGGSQIQYVENGLDSTFTLSEEYFWSWDPAGEELASEEVLKNITEETTLYATYRNRTVSFETNGGTAVEDAEVLHGAVLSRPNDPVKAGFTLEGWYTDEALTQKFDFSNPVTENMTLYANWVEQCTISFQDAQGNPILENLVSGVGMELTLPDHYSWTDADGQTYQGGETITIMGDTVLTGEIYTYKITFYSNNQVHAEQENIPHGTTVELPADPAFTGHRFLGWYIDAAYTQPFNRDVPITGNLEIFAQWGFDVRLNYLDLQGNLKKYDTLTHVSGDTIVLPEHYVWLDLGADAEDPSDDTIYSGGDTITLLRAMSLTGTPEKYTVSYLDQAGNAAAEERILEYGSSFFFPAAPEGCVWEGSDGSHYVADDYYGSVESDLTFIAVEKSITIHYTVNFPAGAVNAVDAVPTLYGTTLAATSDVIPGGTTATIRSLTSNTARREISSSNKESITYFFQGWKLQGTDTLIASDTVLTWSALAQYADAQGNIRLTGQWEEGSQVNSVTFFVQFNSVAMDTDGNITSRPIENFTTEIFNTHLGGLPSNNPADLRQFQIADTTADNSYTADQAIRALYGERAEGIWMYEFPHDDDIFVYLKDYLAKNPSKSLSVDGEKVLVSELDAKHYAIRWYVFKLEGSSWHVDGKLVRREGLINIYKNFQGEENAITKVESGFYVLAENGTKDASGTFTPYASGNSHFKQHILTIHEPSSALRRQYPNATFSRITQGNAEAHSYYWLIRGVVLDEYWRITEYPSDVSGYSHYAEYSVYDSDGELTAIAEYGTQASVVGKTFALDEDPDQGMTAEFTNFYFENHSILLKKEDAATGAGIGGAGFNFIQKDNILTFNQGTNGIYSQSPDAANTDIMTASNGYATIEGFSYQYGADSNQGDRGRILIQESVVPEGYGWAATVELGLDSSNNVYIAQVTTIDGEAVPRDQWNQYVELPRNDILIVKNHVTDLTSVTASKVWNTNVPADSVQVVLQANGQNAANIFPGLKNAQVKLSAANNWTHTWEDLPRYAGGQLVSWSIKEVVVGNAPTLADGTTFANWIPVYSSGTPSDLDGDGEVDNWSFTVTNYSKTPKLILTKVGAENEGLAGAIFTLEQVELGSNGWQRVSGTGVLSQTTDSRGQLTFENLVGTYTYRLTEVKAPSQHIILIDSVVFTVDGDGNIQRLDEAGNPVPFSGEFLKHESAYHLTVKNLISVEMPETGGNGILVYWLCGTGMMLTALLLYSKKRKEGRPSF